jgi:uncharacterized protein YbaP (TraB family)
MRLLAALTARLCVAPSLPLALVLLLVASAAPAALAREAVPFGDGLLWRVERPGGPPSHVFGTMHSADPRVTTLPAPVEAVFERADAVLLELVMTARAGRELLDAMTLGRGPDLEALLGAELYARVAALGQRYHLPPGQLRQLKPWVLAMLFSSPAAELAGRAPLDLTLQRRAERRGIPVHGLERVAEQAAVLGELSPEVQIALLEAALDRNPEVGQMWEEVKRAYLGRDLATIYGLMIEQATGQQAELMTVFIDRLLDRRNLRMVERMAPRLAQGGAFVAVGALHLPGERGILRLLEAEGYRVTRVY